MNVVERKGKIRQFFDGFYQFIMVVCKLLLIVDIFITCMAVAGRYVSFIPDPAWSEEVVLSCMAYLAVISAAMALRRNSHIRMTALDTYLPKKLIQALEVLADLAVIYFSIVMVVVGWKYCVGIGSKGFYTSMPWLSKFWQYFPVPLAGVTMLVFESEILVNHVKALFTREVG